MIEDGTGTGRRMRVNKNNEAITRSVNIPERKRATEDADSYTLGTDVLSLTDAAESAVLYIKNNEDVDMHIDEIHVARPPTVWPPTRRAFASTRVRPAARLCLMQARRPLNRIVTLAQVKRSPLMCSTAPRAKHKPVDLRTSKHSSNKTRA